MKTLRRRATRPAFAAVGLAVAMLALTACGGGSSSSDATSAAAPAATTSPAPQAGGSAGTGQGGDFRAAIENYRSCLADNGVTLPSFSPGQGGQGGGNGAPPSGMPTGAPPSGMPSGGPGGGFGGGFNQKPDGVDQDTWDAAVNACADVAPSFGPGQGAPGGGQPDETALAAFKNCITDNGVTVADDDNWFRELDRNDATVSAAVQKCAPLLPQQGDGGAQGSGQPSAQAS